LKNKNLLLTVIIFFLIINTAYYWKGMISLFIIPVFLILIIVYLVLVISLIRQIYFLIKAKVSNKSQLLNIGVITILLTLIYLKPFGVIDYEKFEAEAILVAEREGAANCKITFKLKEDFTFKERNVCFNIKETKGNYSIHNDTIFFKNINDSTEDEYYEFAVIKSEKNDKTGKNFSLIRHKSLKDTMGQELYITKKNEQKINLLFIF
jgi:hypothetical protein